jgi:Cdc25 family phosphatase
MTTPKPIQASVLREWVLSKHSEETAGEVKAGIPMKFKIVDVRDDDYQGGNIPGTLNVPSRQLSFRVDSLVDELKDNEAVVFTCALSQQRGPNVLRPNWLC